MSFPDSETQHLGVKVPRRLMDELRRRAELEDRSVSEPPLRDGRIRPGGGDASKFEGVDG